MGCILRKTASKRSDTRENNDSPVVHFESLNGDKGAKTNKDPNDKRYKVTDDGLSIHSDSSNDKIYGSKRKKDGRSGRIGSSNKWKRAKEREKSPDSANFYDKSSDHRRHMGQEKDRIPHINNKENKKCSLLCCQCCKSKDKEDLSIRLTPSEYYKLRQAIDRKYYGMDKRKPGKFK